MPPRRKRKAAASSTLKIPSIAFEEDEPEEGRRYKRIRMVLEFDVPIPPTRAEEQSRRQCIGCFEDIGAGERFFSCTLHRPAVVEDQRNSGKSIRENIISGRTVRRDFDRFQQVSQVAQESQSKTEFNNKMRFQTLMEDDDSMERRAESNESKKNVLCVDCFARALEIVGKDGNISACNVTTRDRIINTLMSGNNYIREVRLQCPCCRESMHESVYRSLLPHNVWLSISSLLRTAYNAAFTPTSYCPVAGCKTIRIQRLTNGSLWTMDKPIECAEHGVRCSRCHQRMRLNATHKCYGVPPAVKQWQRRVANEARSSDPEHPIQQQQQLKRCPRCFVGIIHSGRGCSMVDCPCGHQFQFNLTKPAVLRRTITM